jgi:hypothetical protein
VSKLVVFIACGIEVVLLTFLNEEVAGVVGGTP